MFENYVSLQFETKFMFQFLSRVYNQNCLRFFVLLNLLVLFNFKIKVYKLIFLELNIHWNIFFLKWWSFKNNDKLHKIGKT